MTRPLYESDGDYYFALGLGRIRDHVPLSTVGITYDTGVAGTENVIWGGGSTGVYDGQPLPSIPRETVEIFSDNINDTRYGTGLQKITLVGLETKNSTEYTTKTVWMDGTTPVRIGRWYRIIHSEGVQYGSGATNLGTITIRQEVTTTRVFCVMSPGEGQSHEGVITVPAGVDGHVIRISMGMLKPGGMPLTGYVKVLVRRPNINGYNVDRFYPIATTQVFTRQYSPPIGLDAGSDVKIVASSDVANSVAYVEYDLALVTPTL